MKLCSGVQILLDIEGEFLIVVSCVLVVWVLGQIIFVGQERPDAAQLQDALSAVQHGQFIHGGKVFATMSSDEFKKGKKITPLH